MHLTPCRDHCQCLDLHAFINKRRVFLPVCGRIKPVHETHLSRGWFNVVLLMHQCPSGTCSSYLWRFCAEVCLLEA